VAARKKPEPIPVVIASHKRAGIVTAHKHVANCLLTCEEQQIPAYAAAHPELEDRLVPHPDGLDLGQTWQFVMDKWPSHFWLDDTLCGIYRIYRQPGAWKSAVMNPEIAYELIQQTAVTARSLGAYLFGFGPHAHPRAFNGLRPMRFGGYSPAGAYGLLEGHKIQSYPKDPLVSSLGRDHYLCLMNAYHHRYGFYDERFAAGFLGTYQNRGGLAETRGQKVDGEPAEVATTKGLQKLFGSDIVRPTELKSDGLTKRDRNPGRRQITMPYRV
jgi:hypothetical protein